MTGLELAAGLTVLAGAALQSAIGFGFALVAAPVLLAATTPAEATGLMTLLAMLMNLLTLVGERRRPQPLVRDAVIVLAWSVPGLVAGVVVLRAVDATAIQIIVTVAVFTSLAMQHGIARRAGGAPRKPGSWQAPAAGLVGGALTTSTGTSGPPIVLLLLGRDAPPARIRDTLTVCFLALAILGFATLMASGTTAAMPDPRGLTALAALVVVGQLIGRPLFTRLAHGHYEAVLTAVLTISAIVGLVAALA